MSIANPENYFPNVRPTNDDGTPIDFVTQWTPPPSVGAAVPVTTGIYAGTSRGPVTIDYGGLPGANVPPAIPANSL